MATQALAPVCPACLPDRIRHLKQQGLGGFPICVDEAGGAGPHTFQDMEQLNAALKNAKAKYPMLYPGAAAPPPATTVQANTAITIGPETRKLLEELAKQPIGGESDLKGILFEAVHARDELEKRVRALEAKSSALGRSASAQKSGGVSLGQDQFVVTAPEWAVEGIVEMANHTGKTPPEWVASEFEAWLEQVFSSAVPS